jgi:hypothetical protein
MAEALQHDKPGTVGFLCNRSRFIEYQKSTQSGHQRYWNCHFCCNLLEGMGMATAPSSLLLVEAFQHEQEQTRRR